MINQTPPERMSTEDRLNEIAAIMMRSVLRLKKRAGETSLREYLTGLQSQGKRCCLHKKEKSDE